MTKAIHNGQEYLAVTTKSIPETGSFEVVSYHFDADRTDDGVVFTSTNYVRALENALSQSRRNENSRFTVYSIKNRSRRALAVCGSPSILEGAAASRREERGPTRAQLIKALKKHGVFVVYEKFSTYQLEGLVEDAESELRELCEA